MIRLIDPGMENEHYGIGVISGDAPPNIQVKILTEFDVETYHRFSAAIKNAAAPLNRFNMTLVEKNFQSFLNVQKFAIRLMSLGREFGGIPDRIKLGESLMSQIVNWLTSFRLFLDHAETNLKRTYGDNSSQVLRFKEQTALAFDGKLGYRFIYQYRNYVQHCGTPVSSITLTATKDEQGNPILDGQGQPVPRVSFRLNRQTLLQDGDWTAILRHDLEQMSETFELEPLALEAMEGLREVDRLLLDIAFEEGARTIADVREALGLLPKDENGVPNLFRFTVEDGPTIRTVSPQPFPTEETIASYEAVSAGTKEPSDLRHTSVLPPPPPFDPDTLDQRIHQNSRAVQLMTLWEAEGGPTQSFVDRVRAIIAEDNGVDPILNGFFNMTAVLIHMTSASIGIDPQGFIGGLLDVYTTQKKDDTPNEDGK